VKVSTGSGAEETAMYSMEPGPALTMKGNMKKGWWKIDYTIEPNDNDLEHIAEEIKKGYDQGEILQEENEKIHNRS